MAIAEGRRVKQFRHGQDSSAVDRQTFEGNNIVHEEEYHQGREGFYG